MSEVELINGVVGIKMSGWKVFQKKESGGGGGRDPIRDPRVLYHVNAFPLRHVRHVVNDL